MFNSNFISISDNTIYSDSICFSYPKLSIYFLEIYLKESDDFAFKVCFYSSVNKVLGSIHQRNKVLAVNSDDYIYLEVKDYIPRKLEFFLDKSLQSCYVSREKYFSLISIYKRVMQKNPFFQRRINFVRNLDFFLFGCLTDIDLTRKLFRKYLSFVRSNLHFDVQDTKIIFLQDQELYFLGFQIKVVKKTKKNYFLVANMKRDKLFLNKMLTRIKIFKKKNMQVLINRVNFELMLYLNDIINFKFSKRVILQRKIWLSVFQQESIRSARLGRLPSTSDSIKFISKIFVSEVNKVYFGKHLVYFFDSYILKMQFLVTEVLQDFKRTFDSQVVSFDVSIDNFLREYEKSLFFFYNETYFKNPYQPV